MKPPTSEEVVFGKGRPAAERARRGKQVGARVMDSLAPASYRYSDRSLGRRRWAEAKRTETSVINASNTLRQDVGQALEAGATLQVPSEQGGKITATAATDDEVSTTRTAWHLKIESAKGRISEFFADVRFNEHDRRGSNMANVHAIDPETGDSHSVSSYVGEGEAEGYGSVGTALWQLHQAHANGTLEVIPAPAEAAEPQRAAA